MTDTNGTHFGSDVETIVGGRVPVLKSEPIIYVAPAVSIENGKPVFKETAWSFAGALAEHDISLQRQLPGTSTWTGADRVFKGERWRLAFTRQEVPLRESVSDRRRDYEKDRIDTWSTRMPRQYDRFNVFGFGLLLVCVFLCGYLIGNILRSMP